MDFEPAAAEGNLLPNLLVFGRLLRRLGLPVGTPQVYLLAEALTLVDLGSQSEVWATARAILVGRHGDLELFDRVFEHFWRAEQTRPDFGLDMGRRVRRASRSEAQMLVTTPASPDAVPEVERAEPVVELQLTYSDREVLRRKDFAELTDEEQLQVRQLLRRGALQLSPRRSRRQVAARQGKALDLRRSLRRSLSHGGELIDLSWRRPKLRRRPLVVLCDISGSMEPYARFFLELIYSLKSATDRLEAFVFSTRLTRITRQLQHRDVDEALGRAAAAVVDWGGGTRIGEAIKRFNYYWARRVLGRGAVVAVISDGWDRGEVEVLESEVARLARSCDRLMWLNPLLGTAGFEPLTRGIRAVLPLVDDFLPLYNLASLQQLAEQLRQLNRPTRLGRLTNYEGRSSYA